MHVVTEFKVLRATHVGLYLLTIYALIVIIPRMMFSMIERIVYMALYIVFGIIMADFILFEIGSQFEASKYILGKLDVSKFVDVFWEVLGKVIGIGINERMKV